MKQLFFFLAAILLSVIGYAQTKRIAHKSHSGAEETFLVAYENNLFGMEYDNEGLNESAYPTSPPLPRPLVADTLIFTGSSVIPIYKSNTGKDSLFNLKPALTDSVRKLFKQQIPASCKIPQKKGYIIPYVPADFPKPPAGKPWLYIGLAALFAAFSGLFSWQYKQA